MRDFILHQIYKTASLVKDAINIGVPLNVDKKKDLLFAQQRATSFHKEYGLTDDRIIIKSGVFNKTIKSLNVRTLSDISTWT